MHPLDYYYYNIPENKTFDPHKHANTLFMYKFHKQFNDKKYVKFFKNKIKFNQHFSDFIGRTYFNLRKTDYNKLIQWITEKQPDYLILKKMESVGGFGVKKVKVEIIDGQVYVSGISYTKESNVFRKYDLLEEFVEQHESINRLNPSCLNTLRIVTVLSDKMDIDIIGAVLRLGVNSDVDNFHSGGIAINIDIDSGCLTGDGFRLAPGEPEYFKHHPISRIRLDGYVIPHWEQALKLVKKASLIISEVRTVGWDVAITKEGVCIIEGNHDWDKIIIEKALNHGIREKLEKYM